MSDTRSFKLISKVHANFSKKKSKQLREWIGMGLAGQTTHIGSQHFTSMNKIIQGNLLWLLLS